MISTLLSLLVAPAMAAALAPQGSSEDYKRADEFRQRFSGKLFGHDVKEQWLSNGQLLYSVSAADGGFNLVLVDPQGEAMLQKKVVLSTDRLREFMINAGMGGRPARIVRIAQSGGAKAPLQFMLSDGQGVVQYDLEGGELAAVAPEKATALHLDPLKRFARSRDHGGRSAIHFVNQLDVALEMIWVDRSGKEKHYGEIKPGGDHWMSTFNGHGFRLRDLKGKTRFYFVAAKEPGIALMTPELEAELHADEPERPKRERNKEPKFRHKVERSGVAEHTVSFVESSPKSQIQPKLHQFNYLKPGDDLGKWTLSILGPGEDGGQKITVVEDKLFAQPFNLNRFQWYENGTKLRFVYNQRGHQILRWIEVDARTGEARTLVEEKSSTFVDYAGKTYVRVMADRNEALWMSERDGWNHLYLIDLDKGGIKRQLTQGEWMVRSVEKVDVAGGEALIKVMGIHANQDPYHQHYAIVNLDSGELTILTDGDGTHQIDWSPDGQYFVDRFSRVDKPTVTQLRRRNGELVCELERGNMQKLVDAGWRMPQRFAAKGRDDQTLIWGVVYRPTNFNPHRKYPVIESIYAGPHIAHVPKAFAVHRKAMEMAELGFVVVQIDGMGTNWRGKKFHDIAWKNLHDAGFPDRKLWMQALAAKEPAMDLSRVGIYGGSAGGQNAMRALIDHHDFYHAAVADCGCHDNRMDKIWWNELWMGWPVDESYSEASNVDHAHRMQGDLLLIVGELDRNVDPASTMQVVDALIKADKDFDLLVMPGAGHGAAGSAYGTRRTRDFFVRKLLGVEPRWN